MQLDSQRPAVTEHHQDFLINFETHHNEYTNI